MHEIILCKLGEVVLMGLNRHSFETKLMSNIRRRTQKFGKFKIYSRQSTIYVEPTSDETATTGAYAACMQVFGSSPSPGPCPARRARRPFWRPPRRTWRRAFAGPAALRWRASGRTSPSPMSSIQISQWVGGKLHEAYPHLKVDVHHPELTVYVEVREDAAYVHAPAEPAAGACPWAWAAAH